MVLWNASWFWSIKECFNEFPDAHLEEQVVGFNTYYLLGLAFYSQALFAIIFIDEKTKDFKELVIHHVCTILLISISKISSAHRIGSLILLLHDFVDIFLYSAKSANEVNYKGFADFLFVMFAVSFFALRLVFFPYLTWSWATNDHKAYYPSSWYVFQRVNDVHSFFQADSFGICVGGYCFSTYYFLLALLSTLIVLNLYWYCFDPVLHPVFRSKP
ncbi:5 TM domain-containing transmembrane protein, partial [Acrasis kona]